MSPEFSGHFWIGNIYWRVINMQFIFKVIRIKMRSSKEIGADKEDKCSKIQLCGSRDRRAHQDG
jgi:hypothetical protein